MTPWTALVLYVKSHFDGLSLERNLSICKQLTRKWGLEQTSQVVEGAALLGWKDLRGLNGGDAIGFRWAREAYWRERNRSQLG